jgi:putative membrane protein insertion efficiency factor
LKSIEFTEEQLGNLNLIGSELFGDETDPRSAFYVRVLHRPKIRWGKILLALLLPALLLGGLAAALWHGGVPVAGCVLIALSGFVLYLMCRAKRIVLCLVRIYQRYAPDAIRKKCRFEPSCSEYMILAIEKYGLFRGLRMGIDRLKRCNINGGGFDDP